MATIDASTTPAPITCRSCGRPLRNPVSRLLRIGSHCRTGLTERQLVDALTGGAVPADPRSSRAPRVTVNAVTSGTVVA